MSTFQLKRFICSNNELTCPGNIAQYFYKALSIIDTEREGWWAGSVSKVRKSIDNKTACISMAIKIEFMCKYISSIAIYMLTNAVLTYLHINCISGLKSATNLPALQELWLLCKNETTMEIFCNNFLSCVLGKHHWKWQKKHKLICELATISDEAFALLVLENIWDEWKDMNVVEFSLRHKEIEKETEKGTKTKKN